MMKIFSKLEPKLDLQFMLDQTRDNLNVDYLMYFNRAQFRTFEELLDLGKQVEIQSQKIKNRINTQKQNSAKK